MSSKFLAAGVAEFAHEVDGSGLGHIAVLLMLEPLGLYLDSMAQPVFRDAG
jgi:hypothetical protein